MKKIDLQKDQYVDLESNITAPIGFGVLSKRHMEDGAVFYACDRVYNAKGEVIIPLDEQFKTIDEISAKFGTTYYITDDEYSRHFNS